MAKTVTAGEGQQHPVRLYLVVWGWLFVLSALSYLVDYVHLQGILRWTLILVLMALKAGLLKTARRYAVKTIKAQPAKKSSWMLLACSIRGH